MDALPDLLRVVRADAALYSTFLGRGRWGVATRGAPGAVFHAVLSGAGVLRAEGAPALDFSAGDLLLLPHGSAHVIADAAETPGRWIRELPVREEPGALPEVLAGEHGPTGAQAARGDTSDLPPPTRILCGTLRFDPDSRELLLPQLPTVLHARGGGAATAWIAATAALAAEEAARDQGAAELLLARLADVLLVQVLRAHAAGEGRGWLGALADPVLARPLRLLHAEPARDWSVAELARRAGVSRTVLFERFQARLGEPPGTWLLRWRMWLARRALRRAEARVGEVGRSVGYQSEAAFTRAFTRAVGATPTAWRKAQLAPA